MEHWARQEDVDTFIYIGGVITAKRELTRTLRTELVKLGLS